MIEPCCTCGHDKGQHEFWGITQTATHPCTVCGCLIFMEAVTAAHQQRRGEVEQALANAWAEHVAPSGIKITNAVLRRLAEAVLPLLPAPEPTCPAVFNLKGEHHSCDRSGPHDVHGNGTAGAIWQDGNGSLFSALEQAREECDG